MVALLFALPWIAAIVWICARAGWSLLSAEASDEIASQASRIRAFSGR